jgi:hypothetical protein
MATPPFHLLLVVADTNFPLDVAAGKPVAKKAMEAIRLRLQGGRLRIPPTVAEELSFLAEYALEAEVRERAWRVLREHKQLGFELENHTVLPDWHLAKVAAHLRQLSLLPAEEINDSLIIVEAAALGATLLISSDDHVCGIDFQQLKLALHEFDLSAPVIASPRDLVQKYLR